MGKSSGLVGVQRESEEELDDDYGGPNHVDDSVVAHGDFGKVKGLRK